MKHKNRPRIVITDANGLANNAEHAFLILDITRKEVEAGNIASVLDRLHVLTDTVENVMRYRESLLFQVRGYDGDRRELGEIPQIRSFFKLLAREWPHWLWFLTRESGSIALLLSMLCDVEIIRAKDGSFGTIFRNDVEVVDVLNDLLHRGSALFGTFNIDAETIDASATSAISDVFR